MVILGINLYHPDSSACVAVDGKLLAAVEEERFKRIKHYAGFPEESIKFCLKKAGVDIKDVDYITIPRNVKARILNKIFYGIKIPKLAFRRINAWKKTFDLKNKISEIFDISPEKIKAKIVNVEHHRAHIASSFFVSPFEKSFLFSADALGDFASTMWGIGEGNKIKILGEIKFPHSLGFYYTAITQYLGFLKFGDEYKVMGLAAFGEPEFEEEFEEILKIKSRLFKLGLKYFVHHKKLTDLNFEGYPEIDILFSSYLEKRLGKKREPCESIERRHQNIASTLQFRFEKVLFHILNSLYSYYKLNLKNLCLSGGCAFNCVANGKIFDNTDFENIYIQPAAGDAGLSIGSAFYLYNQILKNKRDFIMEHAYFGPEYSDDEIEKEILNRKNEIINRGFKIEKIIDEDLLCKITAKYISEGKIVGWFQGKTEWGPRALGARSILCDPRRKEMKDILNKRIKNREPFRPFAPSIIEEKVSDYFEKTHTSPFMLFAYKVKTNKRDLIPAVVHVDGTARLQTVSKKTNPLYYKLLKEFENLTNIPLLLNTSFNENEPIVNKPEEAIDCFLRTKMDVLVIGKFVIHE
ncbi:MAG: carbamoyltransferase C-terminal domain-containing protein [candidate division WOR-3 bacterium]